MAFRFATFRSAHNHLLLFDCSLDEVRLLMFGDSSGSFCSVAFLRAKKTALANVKLRSSSAKPE